MSGDEGQVLAVVVVVDASSYGTTKQTGGVKEGQPDSRCGGVGFVGRRREGSKIDQEARQETSKSQQEVVDGGRWGLLLDEDGVLKLEGLVLPWVVRQGQRMAGCWGFMGLFFNFFWVLEKGDEECRPHER